MVACSGERDQLVEASHAPQARRNLAHFHRVFIGVIGLSPTEVRFHSDREKICNQLRFEPVSAGNPWSRWIWTHRDLLYCNICFEPLHGFSRRDPCSKGTRIAVHHSRRVWILSDGSLSYCWEFLVSRRRCGLSRSCPAPRSPNRRRHLWPPNSLSSPMCPPA